MPKLKPVDDFLAKYTPDMAAQLREAREHLATHFPRGYELVYDNYNALVFAFAATERATDAIVSLAGYPKWVTLFFARATALEDSRHILEGAGAQFRSVRLQPLSRLHEPSVQALIRGAKAAAASRLESAPPLTTVIKSVAAKQRPRKPAVSKKAGSRKVGPKNPRRADTNGA